MRRIPLASVRTLAVLLGLVACRPPLGLAPVDLACVDCDVVLINVGLLRADRVGLIEPRAGAPGVDLLRPEPEWANQRAHFFDPDHLSSAGARRWSDEVCAAVRPMLKP